jgi:hypothetical protein
MSRPVGRPSNQELREDIRRINALLASGFSPGDIRDQLKFTKRQYQYRMSLQRARANDSSDVFSKYMGKVEARYRQLEGIRQKAVQQNKLDTALRAIEDMRRLDAEIVQVGTDLGHYKPAPPKHDPSVAAPTLGMFHDASVEIIDVTEDQPQLPAPRAAEG